MDASTFDEFFESSFRRLVGQIYAMCGNLAESQDCVQEAFVRAWDQRRAIVLHHLCDLSLADIAVETNVAVGTVKARLSRGRTALAALLRDEPEEQVHGRP